MRPQLLKPRLYFIPFFACLFMMLWLSIVVAQADDGATEATPIDATPIATVEIPNDPPTETSTVTPSQSPIESPTEAPTDTPPPTDEATPTESPTATPSVVDVVTSIPPEDIVVAAPQLPASSSSLSLPTSGRGSISGTVSNHNSLPLQDIPVHIYNADYTWGEMTCTDASGLYLFDDLTLGENYILYAGGEMGCSGPIPATVREYWNNAHLSPGTFTLVSDSTPVIGRDFILEPAGYVSGVVTDSVTGNPLENINVNIDLVGGWGMGACTNAAGEYVIDGVPLNEDLRLTAPAGNNWCSGANYYIQEFWDNQLYANAANLFQLTTQGHVLSGKNFVLVAGGTISGTVLNAQSSQPVGSMGVSAIWTGGTAGACTDNSGAYTLPGLPLNTSIRLETGSQYNWCGGSLTYLPEYWNEKAVQSAADLVTLTTAGETASGKNFTLTTGNTITGTVSNGSGTLLGNIRVFIENQPYSTCTDANGSYTLIVPDGSYILRAGQICNASTTPWAEMLYDNTFHMSQTDPITVNSSNPLAAGRNFTLQPGGIITGTVRDALTNAPLANIVVSADVSGWGIGTCTAADGTYTITGVPTSIDVRVHAASGTNWCGGSNSYLQEYWQEQSQWGDASILAFETMLEDDINFTLEAGGVISGRVTDTNGSGIANANVEIELTTGQYVRGICTDGGGYYMGAVPLGANYRLRTGHLCTSSPFTPYAMQWWSSVNNQNAATAITLDTGSETAPNINFVLQAGGTISGTVREQGTNSPQANIHINVDGYPLGVCTDASGHYTIYGLPIGGAYRISAAGGDNWCGGPNTFLQEFYNETPDWSTATLVAVASAVPVGNINFTLQPSGTVSGTVRNDQNQPLANVAVSLVGFNGSDCTDVNGQYTITGVPYSSEMSVSIGGFNWCPGATNHYLMNWWNNKSFWHERDIFTVDATHLHITGKNFVAVPGGLIMGTVRDSSATNPLANVWVSAEASNINEGVCTAGDGTFTLVVPLNISYRVSAGGSCGNPLTENYIRRWWNDQPNADSANLIAITSGDPIADNVNFNLIQGGQISGTVFAANGTTGLENINMALMTPDGTWVDGTCSGPNGVYAFHGVPNGSFVVAAPADYGNWCINGPNIYVREWYNGETTLQNADPVIVAGAAHVDSINFTLDLGGVISGHVYQQNGSTPIEGALVILEDPANPNGEWLATTNTNAAGAYEFPGLSASTRIVRVEADGFATEYYDDVAQKRELATPLSISLGATVSGIDFALMPGGIVQGTVRDVNGNPIPNMIVNAAFHWNGVCTDADGHYIMPGLPLNEPIWMRAGGQGNWCSNGSTTHIEEWWDESETQAGSVSVTITAANQPVQGVDFTLQLGGSISGTIIANENSAPLPNIPVCAFTYSASALSEAVWRCDETEANGVYLIEGVAPVPQRVWVFPEDRLRPFYSSSSPQGSITWAGASPVSVTSGTNTPNINISLAQAAIISGTVYQPDGITPQRDVTISLSDGSYMECSQADGTYRIFVAAGTHIVHASDGPCRDVEFTTQYFNGAGTIGGATGVAATIGATTQNINFTNTSSAICPFVVGIPTSECEALRTLYDTTNGTNWDAHTGWFAGDWTPCDWFGITCASGHVTRLELADNGLAGPLPAALAELSALQVLDLSNNALSGEIPIQLGGLDALTDLRLSSNDLTGSIPTEFGALNHLIVLALADNHLTGSIPSQLGSLATLRVLHLNANLLIGSVPTTVTSLTALGTGTLPDGLSEHVDLGYNGLTAPNANVATFLTSKDPDWAETQTIAATNLGTSSPTNSSVTVTWAMIPYTGDTGHYEVGYNLSASGPFTVGCVTTNKTQNSCTVSDLIVGSPYHFVVRTFTDVHAQNRNALFSPYGSSQAQTTTSLPPVTAPGLLLPQSGTALSNQTPLFDWGTVANASVYEIVVDNTASFASPEFSIVLSDTEVTPSILANSLYYWRVRAANAAGVGPWSAVFTVTIDTVAPGLPVLVAPVNESILTTARPVLSWRAALGATQYLVQLDTVADLPSPDISQPVTVSPSIATPSLALTASLPQGTYHWQVLARDAAGNWSPANPLLDQSFTVNINRSPANGSATTDTTPSLQWWAWTGAASYQVQVAHDTAFLDLEYTSPLLASTVLTQTLPLLDEGTYYWRVLVNGVTPPFFWSFIVTTTPPPAPVTLPTIPGSLTNDPTPLFDWESVTADGGPLSYQLAVDNDSSFSLPLAFESLSTPLTQAVSGSLTDGMYWWRVRAVNVYGVSGAWSSTRTLTIDTTPPSVPTLTRPADQAIVTTVRPTFQWSAVTTANRYRVQISTDDDFEVGDLIALNAGGESNVPSFTPTVSLPLRELYWRVEARDAAGNWSGFSSGVFGTFTVNIMNIPSHQAVTTDSTPSFSWLAYTGAAGGYRIEIATDEAFTNIIRAASSTVTGYTATFLADGVYYWRVRVDLTLPADTYEVTTLSRTLTISAVLPPSPLLSAPTNGLSINNAKPKFEWSAVSGDGGPFTYELMIDDDVNFTSPVLHSNVGNVTEFTLLAPLPAGKYSWHMRAVNAIGAAGGWSATRTLTIDLTAPDTPTPIAPAIGQAVTPARPTLSWGAVTGATQYQVRLDVATVIGTTTLSTTPNTSLAQGMHLFEVAARDAAGNWSAYSTPRSFVVNIHRAPSDAVVTVDQTPTFQWFGFAGVVTYRLEVATLNTFPSPTLPAFTLNGLSAGTLAYTPSANLPYGTYYWRVSPDERPGVGDPYEAPPFYRTLIISPAAPLVPVTSAASPGILTDDPTPLFDWNSATGSGGPFTYEIVIADNANFLNPVLSENVGTATEFTPSAAQTLTDKLYYWRVRAINIYSVPGAWSSARTVTIDTAAPPIVPLTNPANLSIVTTARPNLTWTAVPGANRYRLEIDNTLTFGDVDEFRGETAATTLAVTVSLDQGLHYWRVLARDAAGNWNTVYNTRQFTVNIHRLPANASVTTDTTPAFQWYAWTGALGYQVTLAHDAAFSDLVTGFPITTSALLYTVPNANALPYGTYYWRVRVNKPGSGIIPSAEYGTFTLSPAPPTAPLLIAPASGTPTNDRTPTLVWNSATGLGGPFTYEIVVDNNADFSSPEASGPSSVPNFTLEAADALDDGVYYWRVRTINMYGIPGAWSAARTIVVNAS